MRASRPCESDTEPLQHDGHEHMMSRPGIIIRMLRTKITTTSIGGVSRRTRISTPSPIKTTGSLSLRRSHGLERLRLASALSASAVSSGRSATGSTRITRTITICNMRRRCQFCRRRLAMIHFWRRPKETSSWAVTMSSGTALPRTLRLGSYVGAVEREQMMDHWKRVDRRNHGIVRSCQERSHADRKRRGNAKRSLTRSSRRVPGTFIAPS